MGKRPPPCSKRELYKNWEICTSISMSYDQILFIFNSAFYESLGRGDRTKSLKASERPTCFDANNEGFGRNQ